MQFDRLKRRSFITLLGGAAAAWPVAAHAQRSVPVRRMGLLMPFPHGHPVGEARLAAFLDGLEHSGWTDGQNVRIDIRWAGGNANDIRRHAGELADAVPDIIMAFNSSAVAAARQATRTIPIVFTLVADPVGAGYVDSLPKPGGNVTGFLALEYAMSGKWLELLKEIVPSATRVAVLRDSGIAGGPGQFGVIQATAASFGVELRPVDLDRPGEIEHAVTAFGGASKYGLIVTGSPRASLHRDLIVTLAARHKLPAVYYERSFVAAGGLISYGSDFLDQCRRAAGYVDRILKGEKPGRPAGAGADEIRAGDQHERR